jgi:SNF family Na+-dependent transporter
VLENRQAARAEFLRMMKWILVAAVAMVAAALLYLNASGDLTANLVIATTLGVFFSVLLGCGLFAAAFFSDKSGHDQSVDDATDSERHRP